MPVVILIGVVLLGMALLRYTRFGRHVYAVGGNEEAARLSGVNTARVKVAVYALSGLLAGLAGIALSSRVMSGNPGQGVGYELEVIAAVVIGGTSLAGGVGRVLDTFVGALLIGVMSNGLTLMGVHSYYQRIIQGVIIVLAVLLDLRYRR